MRKPPFATCVIAFMVSIAMVILISKRGNPVVLRTNLENIPMQLAGFTGTNDSFPESVYKELNADKHIYRHYRSPDGEQIDLYIGYYGTAKGGRTGHNPHACLPGAGWGIIESSKITLTSSNYPEGVTVNYILSRKGDVYEVVLYWYQTRGTVVLPDGIAQNIQRFIGKVLYNRNDGAFVRVSATTDEQGIEKAKREIIQFGSALLSILPDYWPLESNKLAGKKGRTNTSKP